MKTIIAATDFSDEARFAAERAAIIAEDQRAAEKNIRELIRESHIDSDRVSYAVEGGDPSPVILAKAEKLLSDLIVIGKHGQSWIEDLFLGSTTHHVLARSECDVLVVQERV
ncbi:MAG TPA: universal stress protein [Terriglobales bacterium]|nr:universal stress protein [Terriglobales bacterium]